jgi:hypothetical protein
LCCKILGHKSDAMSGSNLAPLISNILLAQMSGAGASEMFSFMFYSFFSWLCSRARRESQFSEPESNLVMDAGDDNAAHRAILTFSGFVAMNRPNIFLVSVCHGDPSAEAYFRLPAGTCKMLEVRANQEYYDQQ